MKSIIVFFHGDCWDGFSGSYAAWKKFGARAEYRGMTHGDPMPKGLKNKEIYVIDFTFPAEVMKKLLADNKKVVALDHHVTAEKTTKMATEYVYQLNHSGAVIAWNYFHPGKKVPELLRHVEDVDLWNWKLPKTAELMAYMGLVDFELKPWDKIAKDWENAKKRQEYIKIGKYLLRYEDRMVQRLFETAQVAEFEGYRTLVVNTPVLHSELGNRLVKAMPPISITWSEKNGVRRVSLRSDGKTDVSKLAQKYGGGGHKAASGFAIKMGEPLPWKFVK